MAAVNKNFVIKNGLEVDTNLIVADAQTNKVGIGTTVPQYILHVNGGIGVTNAYVSGITTVINELRVGTGGTIFSVIAGPAGVGQSVGVGTSRPAFLLDVRSPVSTGQTALYVQGDVRITGDLVVQDDLVLDEVTVRNITVSNQATTLNLSATGVGTITTLNSTSGTITTFNSTNGTITTLSSTNGTITNLNVTGISTLGTVKISSGIVTATSGIVTYFGDGSRLTGIATGLTATIGIQSGGFTVGTGITLVNVVGTGFTADVTGTTANLYLPPPGVSLGLAIALGG